MKISIFKEFKRDIRRIDGCSAKSTLDNRRAVHGQTNQQLLRQSFIKALCTVVQHLRNSLTMFTIQVKGRFGIFPK